MSIFLLVLTRVRYVDQRKRSFWSVGSMSIVLLVLARVRDVECVWAAIVDRRRTATVLVIALPPSQCLTAFSGHHHC
jgi:hypothetical protein